MRVTEFVIAAAPTLQAVLDNVRNWLMGIAGAFATVCLTIAFLRRMAGATDPGEIEKSKVAFRAACWGYGGMLLTPLVVQILTGLVGA
ncbi:hypothetical protein JNUCC0626_13800 [Lentzea sp. JNUCC 0626]|uniref:hypothetical protein n=1 Tax=Lentzea sp. JNUCC 0626 TaxID=3367513 RepID=UPI0037484E1B